MADSPLTQKYRSNWIWIFLIVISIFVGFGFYLNHVKRSQPPQAKLAYLNPKLQYEIGKAFYLGENLPKDNAQALSWLLLAAGQGNKEAIDLIHIFGQEAQGIPPELQGMMPEGATLSMDVIPPRTIKTKLDDIAGLEEAKSEIRQLITFIKNPEVFNKIGAKPPKGIMLYGLPGTGKTLLAQAIAGEADVTFISVSGAAFEETFVGKGAARVRELFAIARKQKPAIIFIDEIDAMAPSRSGEELHQSQIQTVNQLLTEMANLDEEKNADIYVIAATNRLEAIDPALLRPGRFDWQIHIRLPTDNDREAILHKLLNTVKLKNINMDALVEQSAGFSGADLAHLINEAAIFAVTHGKKAVDNASFDEAFKKMALREKELNPAFSIKILSPNEIKSKLSDVAGMSEAKAEVTEVIEFLNNPKKFSRLGARPPVGILIYGPPGTGKTLMARAIAGSGKATFIAVSGAEFDEKYIGVGASRVKELFKVARKYKPCVVFIDEIDALAPIRSSEEGSHRDQTINQFLNEMDNIQSQINEGIIFIGATNRIDSIDPAILRPGRFDRKVYFRLPSLQERIEILNLHLKKIQSAPDVKVEVLAKITSGYSGADLANLVNEAAIEATRKNKPAVDMASFEEANDKISMGVNLGTASFSEAEKKRTAYHEAGHALVGLLQTEHPRALHKLSIGLRGSSLGVTHFKLNSEDHSYTKQQYEALVATALGGYAAEELIYGKNNISGGASSDLVNANQMVKEMVTRLGMADNQSLIVAEVFPEEGGVLESADTILKRDYQKAKDILSKNIDKLHLLANTLLEKETLDYEQIVTLLKLRPDTK
ncbi:MAG: AAA family ATPase [Candidatus Berkiellales bacterium]